MELEYTTKINSTPADIKTCKSIEVYKELCENFDIYEKISDDKPVHPYFDIDYYDEQCEYDQDLTDKLTILQSNILLIHFKKSLTLFLISQCFHHHLQISFVLKVKLRNGKYLYTLLLLIVRY